MKYLLALVVLLVACAPAQSPQPWNTEYSDHARAPHINTLQIPVWIDSKFDDTLTVAIGGAFTEWNVVLNGRWRFNVLPATPAQLEEHADDVMSVRMRAVPYKDRIADGVLGWWDPNAPQYINIVVDQLNVPEKDMKTVIEHEIGHWFGLEHQQAKGTLMFPGWSEQSPCIDFNTVAALSNLRGWPVSTMNWCTP